MSKDDFKEFLKSQSGQDIWPEIEQKMKFVVKNTIKAVRSSLTNRKNTWEIYGFDLMIDTSYNVWLIEVNSSPTMEYSTKITERMCKAVLEDIGKIIINYIWNRN